MIKETILHPEQDNSVDLYPKTNTNQVEGLLDFVKNNSYNAKKVSITVPEGTTKGTITDEQLATLQANQENYIEMVNDKELYYLNDAGHIKGYLTYSHVSLGSGKAMIKTFAITVSVKKFTILITVIPTESGGGKLYRHLLKGTANAHFVSGSSVMSPVEYEMIFITDSGDSMKVDGSTAQNDKLREYAGCYITAYGTVRVKTSDEASGNYYAFDACGFKHEGSPGVYSVSYLYMYDPTNYGQLNSLTKVSAQIATVDSDTVTEL